MVRHHHDWLVFCYARARREGETVFPKEARLKRNRDAREKGKRDGVIEEGKSLLSMVGDVADLAFTGIVGGDNAQGLYSWVKGQVGALTERNATVQGTITGVNNAIDYTGDLVTGQKSGEEIWQDVTSAGKAYAKPFMDLKGEDNRTMLTLTEQESHDTGRNDVGATMRVVDTAGHPWSRMGSRSSRVVVRSLAMLMEMEPRAVSHMVMEMGQMEAQAVP